MRRLLCAAALLTLAGCQVAGETAPVENLGTDQMHIWTDSTTGCRYYIYRHPEGNATFGGITIRYQGDGTPDCPARERR